MRTVILASHGHLASGMKNTVEMILGEQEALFPQSLLCGFKLRLCRLLSGGKQGSVFTVEFHLTAPFHPVFTLAHTLFRAEQVDLVQLGILTHFHDCDTQVPHGLGCAGVLHAL